MEYRWNQLRCMYIPFALGIIANAEQGKRLVEYRLYIHENIIKLNLHLCRIFKINIGESVHKSKALLNFNPNTR